MCPLIVFLYLKFITTESPGRFLDTTYDTGVQTSLNNAKYWASKAPAPNYLSL